MSSRGTDHLGGGREVLSDSVVGQNRVIPGFVGNAVDDVAALRRRRRDQRRRRLGRRFVSQRPDRLRRPQSQRPVPPRVHAGRRRVAQAVGRRRRASRQVVRGAAGIAVLRLRRLRRRGRDVVRGVRVGGRVGAGVGSAHRGGGAEDPRVGRGVAKRVGDEKQRREKRRRRGSDREAEKSGGTAPTGRAARPVHRARRGATRRTARWGTTRGEEGKDARGRTAVLPRGRRRLRLRRRIRAGTTTPSSGWTFSVTGCSRRRAWNATGASSSGRRRSTASARARREVKIASPRLTCRSHLEGTFASPKLLRVLLVNK